MSAARRYLAFFAAIGIFSTSGNAPEIPTPGAPLGMSAAQAVQLTTNTVRAAEALSELPTGLTADEVGQLAVSVAVEAQRSELPAELILAVIRVESSGNTYAMSHVGAMGLMQMMPATAESIAQETGIRWTGAQSLFEPAINVRLGAYYLRTLIDRYGSVPTALAAYNWGPTRIASRIRRGQSIPALYADKVLGAAGTRLEAI